MHSSAWTEQRQRRALQSTFVLINLVLVEVHLPGLLWVGIGAIFWGVLVGLAIWGGSWMCGWVCWIGAVQDLFEPWARQRIKLDPRRMRLLVLVVLGLWVPVGWLLVPAATQQQYTPFGFNLSAWPAHLFQLSLMLLAGLSVLVLGKRGLCRYVCPFNTIVGGIRRRLRPRVQPLHPPVQPLHPPVQPLHRPTVVCGQCKHGCSLDARPMAQTISLHMPPSPETRRAVGGELHATQEGTHESA